MNNKELISDYQLICLIALFVMGTATMLKSGMDAAQDVWLAFLIALLFASFIVLVFVRLQVLFPGKNLFEICIICFGRFGGTIFVIMLTWYAFHAGALGVIEAVIFIIVTSLDKTPAIVVAILFVSLMVIAVKEGIEVMGRAAGHIIVPVVALIAVMSLALIPEMDPDNFLPVLAGGAIPLFEGAFTAFSFPMGEIILIPMILNSTRTMKRNIKVYLLGLWIGGLSVLTVAVVSVSVLGVETATTLDYPSYVAASRIHIRGVFRGAEILVSILLVLGSFLHLCVFLLGAVKGMAVLTNSKNYRVFVIPVALFMLNYTFSWTERLTEYIEWADTIWHYYAVPMQVLLPLTILLGAEVKNILTKK